MILKWGIIGCGDVCEHKGGPALYRASDSELVAVMRRDREKAADFAVRHGAKRHYNKVEDLLADPEVNAVYIATPVNLHHPHTIQAARAGKHIFCEKPMALNALECEEMIRVCKENEVELMVAYYRRFFPEVVKMKEILEGGEIGKVVLARVQYSGFYHQDPSDPNSWRVSPEVSGGGGMMDLGSHRLDLLNFLLGQVEDVAAFTDTQTFDFPVDDSAALILRFEGGAQAVANFNWNIKVGSDIFEVYTTEGKLAADRLGDGRLKVYHGGEVKEYESPPHQITHLPLVENFVQSLNSGVETLIPGEEGLRTSQVLDAAYRSSKSRKVEKAITR